MKGVDASVHPRRKTAQIPRAELLRRVLEVDVLKCARCGGRMKIIATVHRDPEAVRKILTRRAAGSSSARGEGEGAGAGGAGVRGVKRGPGE